MRDTYETWVKRIDKCYQDADKSTGEWPSLSALSIKLSAFRKDILRDAFEKIDKEMHDWDNWPFYADEIKKLMGVEE